MTTEFKGCMWLNEDDTCGAITTREHLRELSPVVETNWRAAVDAETALDALRRTSPSQESFELAEEYQKAVAEAVKNHLREKGPLATKDKCNKNNSCSYLQPPITNI